MFRLNMILKISHLLIFIALVNIIIFPLIYWQCPMERINKKSERIKRKKKQEKRTQQNKWVIKNNPKAFGPNNPGLGYHCSRPSPRGRSLSLSLSACDDWATPPPPPPCVRSRRSSLDPSPTTSVRQVFPLAPFPFSS